MKKYRSRIYYTEADKALMWDRWQQGDSLHAIARLFNRHHPSIRRILAETGGSSYCARACKSQSFESQCLN